MQFIIETTFSIFSFLFLYSLFNILKFEYGFW